jgi:hypothetical protein
MVNELFTTISTIDGIKENFEGNLLRRKFSGNVCRLGEEFGGANWFITNFASKLQHRFS